MSNRSLPVPPLRVITSPEATTSFEFTLVCTLDDDDWESFEEKIRATAGDAVAVTLMKSYALLKFTKKSSSLVEAIESAVLQARAAGATIQRIEPDPLVNLREMALRANMAPSVMTHYHKGHRLEGFPVPKAKATTVSPLWDWADVSEWLFRKRRIGQDKALTAATISAANDALVHQDAHFSSALRERLGLRGFIISQSSLSS